MAFVDTRDRTVIGGDVFTSYGKLAVTDHFNIRFPLAAPATVAVWLVNRPVTRSISLRFQRSWCGVSCVSSWATAFRKCGCSWTPTGSVS